MDSARIVTVYINPGGWVPLPQEPKLSPTSTYFVYTLFTPIPSYPPIPPALAYHHHLALTTVTLYPTLFYLTLYILLSTF